MHAVINCDVARRVLPIGSDRVFDFVIRASSDGGQTMVNSVSLGHAATNSKVGGGQSLFSPCDPITYGIDCPMEL